MTKKPSTLVTSVESDGAVSVTDLEKVDDTLSTLLERMIVMRSETGLPMLAETPTLIPGFRANTPWDALSDLNVMRDVLGQAEEMYAAARPQVTQAVRAVVMVIQSSLKSLDQRSEFVNVRDPWVQGALFLWLKDNWEWLKGKLDTEDEFDEWVPEHTHVKYSSRQAYMMAVRFVMSERGQAMLDRHDVALHDVFTRHTIDKYSRAASVLRPPDQATDKKPALPPAEAKFVEEKLVDPEMSAGRFRKVLRDPERAVKDESYQDVDDEVFVENGGDRMILRLNQGGRIVKAYVPDVGGFKIHTVLSFPEVQDATLGSLQADMIESLRRRFQITVDTDSYVGVEV